MNRSFFTLFSVLLIKALLMLWAIQSTGIGLGPDEAQYWTWSRELDFGYYSKPPGVAWTIAAGTFLFGDTELGVRFSALVIGFLIPLAVYFLARACRLRNETAFWAGLIMAFSPIGVFASFLATTDGGMVLFWTLGCLAIAHALSRGVKVDPVPLGVCILAGALFKWPIYLLWVFALPFCRVDVRFIGGFLLSLCALLPALYWNISHDFATFRHVFSTVKGGAGSGGIFGDFIGAQAVLFSPIFFGMLLFAFGSMLKNIKKMWPAVLFCGFLSLILLSSYTLAAGFKKMQGNWCVFAYPTASVLVAWYGCEHLMRGRRWLKGGLALSVTLCIAAFVLPLPFRYSPFRHNLGWENLDQTLAQAGYDPERHFLFADKYQTTSLLSFYGPGQKRAYFLNLRGARKNQFSCWPGMAQEQEGKTGFFVSVESEPHLGSLRQGADLLSPYCGHVEHAGDFSLVEPGVKVAAIYRCEEYNGSEPEESGNY